jgi:FMN hydrolase / 5-amino-6-(5-phospho-D-ribitylamino)uracil phosphatase
MPSEVRVVTFDLDNTLWKTGATIGAANDALSTFMSNVKKKDGSPIQQPVRVENIMGDLFRENPSRYCPLETDNPPKAAVLLTRLRIDAIKVLLEKHNDFSEDEAETVAQEAFSVWFEARHAAIPDHYASSVMSCLDRISKMKTSRGYPILIGAITDGNSDPRKVEGLEKYFQFCINAESVGIAKPDKRVYHEAIRHVFDHPYFEDINDILSQSNVSNSVEKLEDLVGPYWVVSKRRC